MELRFQANDGQEYAISDFTVLHELITKGVITGTTLLYDEDSKTWMAAGEHPAARDHFAANAPDETAAQKTHEPLPMDTRTVHQPKKKKLEDWLFRAAVVSFSALALFGFYSVKVTGKVVANPIKEAFPLGMSFVLCGLLAVLAYIIGRTVFGDARRSFLMSYFVLFALALAGSFYLVPSPRTQSTVPMKGRSIKANGRSSSDKKVSPPASNLPTVSPDSPENLAAAQIEHMVQDRLQLEVYRLVRRLNEVNLQEVVLHPSKLGTSWGLQESRRRIAESRLATGDFASAIKQADEELVAAMSNKTIDPAFKKDYLESISQGSWHGMAVPQCQELVVALKGFLTAAENLVAFMTKAAFTNEDGQVIFHDPADKQGYDDCIGRAENALHQVSADLARLHDSDSPLLATRVELVGTPEAKPGEQAATRGGTEVQKSNGVSVATSPAAKEPLKTLLGPGQVLSLDCEKGKSAHILLSDESDGNSEALVSSQEIIKAVLSSQSNDANFSGDLRAQPIPRGLHPSHDSTQYYSLVIFKNIDYNVGVVKTQLQRVPCQPSGISVLCIKGLVSVRVIE